MAKYIFNDKQPGDTLGAKHINKLNAAARIVAAQNPGAFLSGNEYGIVGPIPFVQRVVEVTGSDSGGIYRCRPRYYDISESEENDRWKTDTSDNEYFLDGNATNETFEIRDILPAYWDPQRDAYIPIKSEFSVIADDVVDIGLCECGGCVESGSITDCAAIGEALNSYRVNMPNADYREAFGNFVVLEWSTGCTWVSDVFTEVDLGDGNHDYTWKMVFTGKSIEEVTITLEDET